MRLYASVLITCDSRCLVFICCVQVPRRKLQWSEGIRGHCWHFVAHIHFFEEGREGYWCKGSGLKL